MKKFILILLTFIVLFSLVSFCNLKVFSKLRVNTVSFVKLSDRDDSLLDQDEIKYFVFDFNINTKYKKVELWVNKYEFGKKVSEVVKLDNVFNEGNNKNWWFGEKTKKGRIIGIYNKKSDANNCWSLTLYENESPSIQVDSKEKPINNINKKISWESSNQNVLLVNGDDLVLANCGYSTKYGGITNSISKKYKEDFIKEFENLDVVYLVKCKFSE